jgi:hypothetical protein
MLQGDQQKGLIDISRYDMRLLGEFNRFANNVILAVVNSGDDSVALSWINFEFYMISNRDRIGAFDATGSELATNPALKHLVLLSTDPVPASC